MTSAQEYMRRFGYPDGVKPMVGDEVFVGLTVGDDPQPVYMPAESHALVSGQTRWAGKTTLLQGLSARSFGKKILAFITKRGEEAQFV